MVPWLKAARIPSQLYLASSLLLGHALFFQTNHRLNWLLVLGFAIFGVLLQLYIVFGNDVADFETDKLNKTPSPFSGGSRVLVEQSLSLNQLKSAHYLMTFLSLATGALLGLICKNPVIVYLTVASLILLWMYSYPPFKLSYRGGGEFLQAIGLGVILPCMAYIGQGGANLPFNLILALIPSHVACAIGTSLPDEPSDRLSKKHTFTVMLGQRKSCLLIALLQLLSFLCLGLMDPKLFFGKGSVAYFGFFMLGFLLGMQAKPGHWGMNAKVFLVILFTQSLIGISIWNCFQ
ncbi:MAG: prenyltransferase [Oligoflexales bacterium]|nr:prenyltransferase [Oligoflexales bacterium]